MSDRVDARIWSAPDDDGVMTCVQPQAAKSTLKSGRRRRGSRRDTAMFDSMPPDWRALLAEWLREANDARRWSTLLKIAGEDRWLLANQLCRALLVGGWIELGETRKRNGEWTKVALHWRDRAAVLRLTGQCDPEATATALGEWSARSFRDPRLPALADTLAGMPAARHLRRLQLLHRLDDWLAGQQRGTRRRFAHFARDDTKALSDSEWQWLDESLGLVDIGIDAHLPGIWLRAPLTLTLSGGRLDVAALPEPLALTPATLAAIVSVSGQLGCWRVLENRTCFEQAAAVHGDRDGVLWVPGFPGAWWRDAVATLLRLAPAPAMIACDHDPAGIRIALQVAAVWVHAGLPWRSWAMSAASLQALRATRALNDYDRAELDRLRQSGMPGADLDADLDALAEALSRSGRKGEQEGLDFI